MIWSNRPGNIDSVDEYVKQLSEDKDNWSFSASEEAIAEAYWDNNAAWLADEVENIKSGCAPCEGNIILIAKLDFWNGPRQSYREINTNIIGDCLKASWLRSESYSIIYVNSAGDLCQDESHHDGINEYVFREITKGGRSLRNLEVKLLNNTAVRADALKTTRAIGNRIAKLYGWLPNEATVAITK